MVAHLGWFPLEMYHHYEDKYHLTYKTYMVYTLNRHQAAELMSFVGN